jgi:uncharacterized protein RhaS with RHS repeats
MKTKLNQTPWLVLAAFLLAGRHAADAWYSPSQQRWIIRDPIEEKGGINLYAFVGNHPISSIDIMGLNDLALFGPEMVGLVPQAQCEDPYTCGKRIADEVNRSPVILGDRDGLYQHCVASCRISRECLGGRFAAWIGGDWIMDPWWQSPEKGSDPRDRYSNKKGRAFSKKSGFCEDQCAEAYRAGELDSEPPPPSRRPYWPDWDRWISY